MGSHLHKLQRFANLIAFIFGHPRVRASVAPIWVHEPIWIISPVSITRKISSSLDSGRHRIGRPEPSSLRVVVASLHVDQTGVAIRYVTNITGAVDASGAITLTVRRITVSLDHSAGAISLRHRAT